MFIDFNNFYKKENSTKLIILGVILLAVGVNCISRKTMGINVFSWGMGIALLYVAWLCLKEVNELRRYATKKEVNKYRIIGVGSLIIAILLFAFPLYVNMALSVVFGIYILYYEISGYLRNRRYAYYRFGTWKILKIVIGILLIVSPLFLSRFMVTILSAITIIFGVNFLTTGLGIRNNEGY